MNETIDQSLTDEFVRQAKAGLIAENEEILSRHGKADTWAWTYMTRPNNMHLMEFGTYSRAVGDELVVQGVLKVDRRKKRGLAGHNPLRLRLSKKWFNKNRKEK